VQQDERFLAALQNGLPDCSGIAIGLDRLLMIISQKNHILIAGAIFLLSSFSPILTGK
jgi:elongation factor P--beta-lysine ligase